MLRLDVRLTPLHLPPCGLETYPNKFLAIHPVSLLAASANRNNHHHHHQTTNTLNPFPFPTQAASSHPQLGHRHTYALAPPASSAHLSNRSSCKHRRFALFLRCAILIPSFVFPCPLPSHVSMASFGKRLDLDSPMLTRTASFLGYIQLPRIFVFFGFRVKILSCDFGHYTRLYRIFDPSGSFVFQSHL